MAKKRKASGRNSEPSGPREVDPSEARLGPISTYQDVADSEDEFFMDRDKILMDEPETKRRKADDSDMDFSDEEVLAYRDKAPAKKSKKGRKGAESEDEAGQDGEDEDTGYWGSSKGEYYNADNIETEADALEEEAEAKRLQQKKLAKMAEEDFIFDEDEWKNAEPEKDEEEDVVTEVLKDVEITDEMGPEERLRLLKARYPEFEPLAKEFQQLQPQLKVLEAESVGKEADSIPVIKFWVLGCYIAALASYFALLTSPARDVAKENKTLDPVELRDHDVMATLIECRDAWRRVEPLEAVVEEPEESLMEVDIVPEVDEAAVKPKKTKKSSKLDAAAEAKRKRKLERAQAAEASVADLYNLPVGKASRKKQARDEVEADEAGDNSDFGEETAIDERTAAEKAARKKSLKFYTSQIVQKANKRADASRDAGGDADIPHRERLRDRQARLQAEAARKGQKAMQVGADLGDDSADEEDIKTARDVRDDGDDYYDMVARSAQNKKDEKIARAAAYAAASAADRVVEQEEIGEDGKRKVTYMIEKNKGLAPKRKKENRNPRVKKRMQYEAKQKKLRSMKPMFKGGEPKGGYQGEARGININVVKSTKL